MALVGKSVSVPLSPDFRSMVAVGKVPGWTAFRKFGMNADIDGGPEEMWPLGTIRTLPAAAAVASVVSSSVADDGDPAGTGAWTLLVDGLDSAGLPVTEVVTLNGTSAVTTTQTFFRVNRAFVVTVGANESNEGNITISVGGNPQAYIEADEGQTHQTGFTVPADKFFLVDTYIVTVGRLGNDTLECLGQIRLNGDDTAWRSISDLYLGEGQYINPNSATLIPPLTDVRQLVVTNGTNRRASSVVSGFFVEPNEVNL